MQKLFEFDEHIGAWRVLVQTRDIQSGAVSTRCLADEAVTEDKLADGSVTGIKIGTGAVTEEKIADGAIDSIHIKSNTVSGEKLADEAIESRHIKDNSIGAEKIKDGTIENVDIKDGTLDGSKIKDGTIEGAKMADNAIESRHLIDNSIPGSKIKDGTIENVDIKDGTLDGSKIKDNTIQGGKLADGAISNSKIVDGSVTESKIGTGAVTESKVGTGAVTESKIGTGAVTENKISDGAVTENKLAPGAVTTDKLSDGVISELQTITDAVPTASSVKPVQSGGTLDSIIKHGSAFDLSAYNSGTTYADLTAALTALNSLPSTFKKGGMSFKYVQTSDNKYVQYRLMADEWSINVYDWSFMEGYVYVDNPEFIAVYLDADGRILKAIKKDGTELLAVGLEIHGDINTDGADITVIENPEFAAALLDNDGKIIFGVQKDANFFFGAGVPKQIINYVENRIAELSLDEYEDIVAFLSDYLGSDTTLKAIIDGINAQIATKVDKVEGKSLIDAGYASSQSAIENPEFIEAKTDSEGKLFAGRTPDGAAFEKVGFSSPKVSIDNHTIENIEDPEGRSEITTDSEGKIISYRNADGVKHENVGIDTPNAKIGTLEVESIKSKDGDLVELTTKEYEYIERPKFAEFYIYNSINSLPCDTNEVIIKVNNRAVLHANCSLAIQGHGSVQYAKKGYTINFTNANGDELAIKFGNMIAVDSFHLKGYATDRTHARGIGNARFWRDFVRQLGDPYAKVNNIPFDMSADLAGDVIFISDANYCEDGFPVAVYVNDEFWGLHSLKLKKTRQNYAMQKSVKNEIFLDSITYTAYLNEAFDHTDWELKNPKLKNYEEGGEISDAGVLANIERLFGFTSDIANQKDNYADYIVLPHWIAWVIVSEIIGNRDTNGNNMNLLTWDGTHWTLIPYDLDLTLGLDPWNQQGYVIETSRNAMCADATFFNTFRSLFEDEIKETYTRLRKSGFISVENIYKYYVDQVSAIPRDIQEKDKETWENIWTNGYPTIEQIHLYLVNRIDYLDNLWLLPDDVILKANGSLIVGNILEIESTEGLVKDAGIASSDITTNNN